MEFYPDSLLPDEFYKGFNKEKEIEPEKRLMLAVLEEAVWCFQKHIFDRDNDGQKIFRAAEEWILDENSEWLFSFNNICETLGLDTSYMRQGLMRWKEKQLSDGRRETA